MHVSNMWLVPPLASSDVQAEDSRNAHASVYVYSLLNAHVKMLCMCYLVKCSGSGTNKEVWENLL